MVTDLMDVSLSELWELVMDREAQRAAITHFKVPELENGTAKALNPGSLFLSPSGAELPLTTSVGHRVATGS